MKKSLRARVFISCGQQGTDEVNTAHSIAERLQKMGFDPYIAVEQQSLEGLKESIFRKLRDSEYFIFIDFKREKLDVPGNEDVHRGSLFSHQELAIAAFLNIEDLLAFQEEGVKKDDAILKFIQANCIPFTSPDKHLLPDVVVGKVIERGWKSDWRNELILVRDEKDYEDAFQVLAKKMSRFYHIKVQNLHKERTAYHCVAYLESVKYPTGERKTFEAVELKWKGVKHLYATIPPSSFLSPFRYLDGFFVFHDSPNIAYIGINPFIIDFSAYRDRFKLEGPGDFRLTYVVFSENFPPAKATFELQLGNSLDDIKFYITHEEGDVA
ncbi:MAG: hypothetical protein QMC85_05190 [Methanocellales archaeon]|nr:hypothetical protein [Methanocellales archaeon]